MTRLSLWGPVVLQMALIFAASSVPDVGTLPQGISDKSAHGLAYGILAAALLRALAGGRLAGVTLRRACAAVALAVAYGASDEFHQRFVSGRTSDLYDIGADAAGAALAVAAGGAAAAARAWGILAVLQRRRGTPPSVQ